MSWVVFANTELDPICFGKGMSGTLLDKPGVRALDRLEEILGKCEWLCGEFGVADVAVASYLNYVPVFFPRVWPASRPNICKYMKRCAERSAFSEAFGDNHASSVIAKATAWLDGT